MNPFDENALEVALMVKDVQEAEITVLSMGRYLAPRILKKTLASGADRLILLQDDAFENLDSFTTAYILASGIKTIGKYDLILCGKETTDSHAGQVGFGIAEILGIPSISAARKVEVKNEKVCVERIIPDGYELIEASMPSLIITTNDEFNQLRSANLETFVATQKWPHTTWNASDLGITNFTRTKQSILVKLFTPTRDTKCQFIKGTTDREQAQNLALHLRETNLI